MKLKKHFLLVLIIPLLSFSTHKYYLSLTQIKFKESAKSVQIITSVFMDDIELEVNKEFDINLQLTTKKELANNDFYFEKYLKNALAFKINEVTKQFKYIGKEYEGDLVYFYLEIEEIPDVQSIIVESKLLLKNFPEQQNLIKSKVGNTNKSVLLTAKNQEEKLIYTN
ncbi:DUF6702 family protein [uncultured Polaribacter sp.]|uniref:DUF6702 family protein n=1 Tax=uncultured Polaribacter sp. TaxID=174711 RepID=UPI0026374E01|nr:DUF6702 family protein [uncultured Polaribacter sp.]